MTAAVIDVETAGLSPAVVFTGTLSHRRDDVEEAAGDAGPVPPSPASRESFLVAGLRA